MQSKNNKDKIGKRFGKLIVISKIVFAHNKKGYWNCQCECGNTTIVETHSLNSGKTKSCGCLQREKARAKRYDLTGKQFHRWQVLSFSRNTHKDAYWICQCECGKLKEVLGSSLRNDRSKSCGCLLKEYQQRIDVTGEVFGRLTAIRRDKGNKRWVCLCECGNEHSATINNLKDGHVLSCGCLQRDIINLPGNLSAKITLFNHYKNGAIKRKLNFELTFEWFENLIFQACFYCGKEPMQTRKNVKKAVFKYNGIDRLDNKIGYTVENSVTACKTCNFAKHSNSLDDFFQMIKAIAIKHRLIGG